MFFLFLVSCQSKDSAKKSTASPVTHQSIHDAFTSQALYINEDGPVLQGEVAILEYLKTRPLTEDSAQIFFNTPAIGDSSLVYEIGSIQSSDKKHYTVLRIMKSEAGSKKTEMEYIAASTDTPVDTGGISQRRAEWMRLCNLHNAFQLVSTMYTGDAIYFNHKPIVVGTEKIAKEYGYMNNPNYSLQLLPLYVKPVTDSLIYEIGQCRGTYGGKYILIWKKVKDGKWMVWLDSNI
jgi:ketosteroid isomerase-like protein